MECSADRDLDVPAQSFRAGQRGPPGKIRSEALRHGDGAAVAGLRDVREVAIARLGHGCGVERAVLGDVRFIPVARLGDVGEVAEAVDRAGLGDVRFIPATRLEQFGVTLAEFSERGPPAPVWVMVEVEPSEPTSWSTKARSLRPVWLMFEVAPMPACNTSAELFSPVWLESEVLPSPVCSTIRFWPAVSRASRLPAKQSPAPVASRACTRKPAMLVT